MTELDTERPPTTGSAPAGWVPQDSFADRLARIRRHHRWNYTQASIECGFPRQNWRMWEVGGVEPSKLADVIKKIHARTGVDRDWLMWGDAALSGTTAQYYSTYPTLGYPADADSPPAAQRLIPAA